MNETQVELETQTDTPTRSYRPLRIWPAAVLLLGMVGLRLLSNLSEGSMMLTMLALMGPMVLGIIVMLWWLTFSRATGREKIVGLIATAAAFGLTVFLADKSMYGPGLMMITAPMGTGAFALGAVLMGRNLSFQRTIVAILLAACGFGYTALLRSDGMWGHFALDSHWRWEESAEQQMMAQRESAPSSDLAEVSTDVITNWIEQSEWPRFRGVGGSSQQMGPAIATDWKAQPPEQVWKIAIGPGWSSFAVAGNLLFTQEQRIEHEAVVCYAADTGDEIWIQQIESRFDDPMGGPGPRATPTLADGGLYVQGANGQLQRLDPTTGDVIWSQDLREIAGREPPTWGFSSSPLVYRSTVVVHAGGEGTKGTLAFDTETGDLKWSASAGDHTYSSPELCTVGENEYVLMLTNAGINLLDPETGKQRLDYKWEHNGYRVLQPQVVDGDSILLATGMGVGTRRIRVSQADGQLAAEELWTSRHLKPDFNDFVIHGNHAYGFDGALFTSIDLETGKRNWKRGRYGKGQVLLLANSGHLLIASEFGEIILLSADPGGHQELTRFQAIEGRTWNHPVLVGDRLYIRNSQEAACYKMPMVEESLPPEV